MPIGNPRDGFFYLTLTLTIDPYKANPERLILIAQKGDKTCESIIKTKKNHLKLTSVFQHFWYAWSSCHANE